MRGSGRHSYSYIAMTLVVFWCFLAVHPQTDRHEIDAIELFDWIGHDGVEDSSLSDLQIFKAIQSGLSNSDSRVVSATVGALAWVAAYAHLRTDDRRSTQKISRNVGSIPGIKEFLLHLWETEFQQNSSPWIGTDTTKFVEIRNSKTVWRAEWAWLTIPAILATFFPKDSDIEEVLWQAHNPQHPELLLSLLNVGEFESKQANNFRVQTLFNPNVPSFATVQAIESLGKFRSDDGLAALVSRLTRTETDYDLANTILMSIATYSEAEIKRYQHVLTKTKERLGVELPEQEEVEVPKYELLAYLLFLVKNGFEEELSDN